MNDLSVGLSVQYIVDKRRIGSVLHHRSDGSRDEAGGGVWRSVPGKGYFGGLIWCAPLSTGTYWAYVYYSAATRPSCQITLNRLVIVIAIIIIIMWQLTSSMHQAESIFVIVIDSSSNISDFKTELIILYNPRV